MVAWANRPAISLDNRNRKATERVGRGRARLPDARSPAMNHCNLINYQSCRPGANCSIIIHQQVVTFASVWTRLGRTQPPVVTSYGERERERERERESYQPYRCIDASAILSFLIIRGATSISRDVRVKRVIYYLDTYREFTFVVCPRKFEFGADSNLKQQSIDCVVRGINLL